MTGIRGGPLRRWEAFVGERLMGGGAGTTGLQAFTADPTAPAADRLEKLAQYRRLKAEAAAAATGRRRGAGLAATVGGPNWVPIGPYAVVAGQAAGRPVVSGRVQDLAVSANGQRVYVATAQGGVWRSLDGGVSWEPMSDTLDLLEPAPPGAPVAASSLATGAVALVDGGDAAHDRLYVGTGEPHAPQPSVLVVHSLDLFGAGLLRSDDGGTTFVPEAATPTLVGSGVYALAPDPANREEIVAATRRGVYRRTAASAATPIPWQEESLAGLGTGSQVTSVATGQVAGATRFYAAVQGGACFQWVSAAAGWQPLAVLPAGAARVTLACSAGDPVVVYALSSRADGTLHGVHRIEPTAAVPAWVAVTGTPASLFGLPTGQGSYDQAMTVDPARPATVYVGGSGLDVDGEFSAAIYRLDITAAGAGFTCASALIGGSAHADVHALVMRPGGQELWAGTDGGVWFSADPRAAGNRLFESRNTGLATLTLTGLAHLPGEDSYAFCGAQDNGGLRYLGSEVWDHQLGGDGGDTVVDWATPAAGARRQLLNIYVRAEVRRCDLDGARYDDSLVKPPAARQLFYPPMVGVPPSPNPADSRTVAFGGELPYLTEDFGSDGWRRLPDRTPVVPPAGVFVRSLAFASATRLWAGWTDGHVARYDKTAAGWSCLDFPRTIPTAETRPVTGIAIDPSIPDGQGVFVTLGGRAGLGDRVWALDSRPTPHLWTSTGGGLLDIQHNSIVVDPADATGQRRWVGADLGVWQWNQAAGTWQVLSANLPDAAVLDLDLVGPSLLRATTYGRGVWELDLSGAAQPAIRLVLRGTPVDRGRPARVGVPLPGARARTSRIDESPDIVVDAPGRDGRYAVDPGRTPTLVELRALDGRREVLASVPEAPATTRVHVTIRTTGVSPGNPAVDAVRVALLLGTAGADDDTAPAQLPTNFAVVAREGTPVDADGWKTVGIRTVGGLRPGRPVVAGFELTSDLLPPADVADGKRFVLLALVHHDGDPLPAGASRDPVALVTSEPRAAMFRVIARPAKGAAARSAGSGGVPANPPGGTGLLVPLTTALLAHQRIGDLVDGLNRKVHSTRVHPGFAGFTVPVQPHPVERRVLAMATAARTAMASGAPAGVPRDLPGAGIGQFALLGALGFELPGFTSVLAPGGGWVSEVLRRGTPDPDRSRVAVPATELPLAVARAGVAAAGPNAAAATAVRGFATGMLAAGAAGVTVGPQLADLLSRETAKDWHRHSPSAGAAAAERHLRVRFLGGDRHPAPVISWLPPAQNVPAAVWDGYLQGVADVYGLPARRPEGFPFFERDFDRGDDLTAVRLRNAYGLLLDDLRTSSWPAIAWFGLLTPVLLASPLAMLAAHALPNAGAFFVDGASAGERASFELLTLATGMGSVAPFLYSMILWSAVDEHTEAFATALLMFLARAGIVIGALATGDDPSQKPLTRWLGLAAPLLSLDVYAAIRAAVAGSRRPGVSTVFAFQTVPALTGLLTLGVTGLMKLTGISSGRPFWLSWSLYTAALWLGAGFPISIALANGGGWRSWFLRSDRRFPLLSSVAAAGLLPPEPVAAGRVFDDSTLWSDPGTAAPADLSGYAYPSGMRGLVTVWWEGAGNLEIRYADDLVTLRTGAGETQLRLPAGTTAASLAQLLAAALPGVQAQVVATGAPDPALLWPRSLADPGDAGPVVDAAVARARFVPVGRSAATGLVLRHAPRADGSTPVGLRPDDAEAFPVVPVASLGDLEGSGLGAAADLATLLTVAAAPSLGAVAVADGLPALPVPAVTEVVQVFRRWNLDERRLAEWQAVVSGGGLAEGPPPAVPDPLLRTPPGGYAGAQPVGADLVAAMGWIPLWRAWIRVATDPQADAAAAFALPSTPLVRFASGAVRRPTNAELTEGVRFLLDLGAA